MAPNRIQQGVNCYADYVRALKENRLCRTALHLSLLPQPYHGDLENAEVIILLKNPGLHASDYFAEENEPEFRRSVVGTIRQEMRSHIFFDPKWAWTSGFTWWESKLRQVGLRIAHEKFNGNYSRALADLARRIACLELVPYHSASFSGTTQIASAKAVRKFAQEASRERTIVVTRAVKDWDVGVGVKHHQLQWRPGTCCIAWNEFTRWSRYPKVLRTSLGKQETHQWLDDIGLLSPCLTVAHGVHLTEDECALLAERGVMVVGVGMAELPAHGSALLRRNPPSCSLRTNRPDRHIHAESHPIRIPACRVPSQPAMFNSQTRH